MMPPESKLLASMLPHFKDKKAENVMTRAVFHVLREHENLQKSFVSWIFTNVSETAPEELRMTSQEPGLCGSESDGGGQEIQPDIQFREEKAGGGIVLMLENKFLAELTPTQPVGYIKALSGNRASGLVVGSGISRS